MLLQKRKELVVAKLIGARNELEDAVKLCIPARYDPDLIPQATRDELSVMMNDIDTIIHRFEEIP